MDENALTPVVTVGLELLRAIPEERVWLEGQASDQTRRAYRQDVVGFMEHLGIRTVEQLRQVDRLAVVSWRRALEARGVKPTTIRRKLAALSSLYAHLVEQQVISRNPVRDVLRPRMGRRRGATAAFSAAEARSLLDAPPAHSVEGLRDRAILAVGLQVGPRRSEIVRLKLEDFHRSAGCECLRFRIKGGTDHVVAVHPDVAARIRAYLAAAGHAGDAAGPLFRPCRGRPDELRRALHPERIDRLVRKYAAAIGLPNGYSAHSLRATCITRALENGASLEEAQLLAGHADASTTKLYDRRGFNPERSASFFATYD